MKIAKSIFLIGLGVGGVMAYQRYHKPVMKEIEKVIDKTIRKADKELEEMM